MDIQFKGSATGNTGSWSDNPLTGSRTPSPFFLRQVCLTGCSRDLMVRVDQLCSQRNIKVFCGDVYGYYGYMFCNLGQEHNYVE